MGSAYPPSPAGPVFIKEVPDIQIEGEHIYFTDSFGGVRVYPRNIGLRTFALFAKRLQEEQRSTAEIIQFPEEARTA